MAKTMSDSSEPEALRKRIAALEEQVHLFEALLASSHDGIAITRPDGTLIRVVRSVLGYATAGVDLAGRNIRSLVYAEDLHIMEASYRRVVEQGERYVEHELRLVRPDGGIAWVEGSMTNMLDHPAVRAIVLNYRDATLRTEQDWTIRELSVVMEKSPYAVFSKSPGGEIVTWHSGAERMFGYTRAEIVSKHIWALVPPELREEESRQRAFVQEQGHPTSPFRTRRIRKDRTIAEIELVLIPLVIHGQIRGIVHLSHLVEPERTGD
jgi:PAS domain S-box-containing protein